VREIAKIGGRRQTPAGIEAVDVDLNPALRFRSLRGAFERDKPVTPGDAKLDDGYPSDAQRRRKMCRLEDTPRVLWIQSTVLRHQRCQRLVDRCVRKRRIDAVVRPRLWIEAFHESLRQTNLLPQQTSYHPFHASAPHLLERYSHAEHPPW